MQIRCTTPVLGYDELVHTADSRLLSHACCRNWKFLVSSQVLINWQQLLRAAQPVLLQMPCAGSWGPSPSSSLPYVQRHALHLYSHPVPVSAGPLWIGFP